MPAMRPRHIDDPGPRGIDQRFADHMESLAVTNPLELQSPEAIDPLGGHAGDDARKSGPMPLGGQKIGDNQAGIIAAAIGIGEGVAIIRVSTPRRPDDWCRSIDSEAFKYLARAPDDHRRGGRAGSSSAAAVAATWGRTSRKGQTRCGALRMRISRSTSASRTNLKSKVSR